MDQWVFSKTANQSALMKQTPISIMRLIWAPVPLNLDLCAVPLQSLQKNTPPIRIGDASFCLEPQAIPGLLLLAI